MGQILVTGAGGELGTQVVRRLVEHDREVIALVTEGGTVDVPDGVEVVGGDVRRRTDIDSLVSRAESVIHLATDPLRRGVDIDGTSNVAYACTEAEKHLLYVSVVGADRSRFPYYRTKAKVERSLHDIPGLSYTIQRATQFYSLLDRMIALPIIPIPGDALFQPVDPHDVASRLVGLIAAGPSGRVKDFAGPLALSVDDMAEIRRAVGRKVGRDLAVPRLGVMREALEGVFVPGDADLGVTTYRDWLTSGDR